MHHSIRIALDQFQFHYQQRFTSAIPESVQSHDGITQCLITSPLMRAGNAPRIFYHQRKTPHVMILLHGLTDSPYYMESIAKRFYRLGVNIILPLLPGHGLQHPGAAIKVNDLSRQWKEEVDQMVRIASLLGDTISLGGLSMGGALSLNKALRHPEAIQGGLFLFSAALHIGVWNEKIGDALFKTLKNVEKVERTFKKIQSGLSWLIQKPTALEGMGKETAFKLLSYLVDSVGYAGQTTETIKMYFHHLIKNIDADYQGIGPNPYKYPVFSMYGALHLTEIIRENNLLLQKNHLDNPIFAAHSAADDQALYEGIGRLLEHQGGHRMSILFSETLKVQHAEVVLETDIVTNSETGHSVNLPKANPDFEGMMSLAMSFFQHHINSPSSIK